MITKLFLDALGTGGNTLIRLGSELRWFRFAIFCLFVDEQTVPLSSNLWNQDKLNAYVYTQCTDNLKSVFKICIIYSDYQTIP